MAPVATVAAVIVTYNPDEDGLAALLDALRPQISRGVIVDNGSANSPAISRLAGQYGVDLIECGENIGIAAAQNKGIVHVLNQGATHVLLSDQDSVPAPNMVRILLETFTLFADDDRPIAAVGPLPVDARGSRDEGLVYSFTKWGPRRDQIPGPHDVVEVPFVLASGCLIPRSALFDLGPMNEALFIDHVDLAWCMGAVEKGYRVLVNGGAQLAHSLGEKKIVLPGGRQVHAQSVARNYYMVRNTLFLERATFMPLAWKMGYLAYLTRYLGFYTLLGFREPRRGGALARGVRDGLTGRGGRRP